MKIFARLHLENLSDSEEEEGDRRGAGSQEGSRKAGGEGRGMGQSPENNC